MLLDRSTTSLSLPQMLPPGFRAPVLHFPHTVGTALAPSPAALIRGGVFPLVTAA